MTAAAAKQQMIVDKPRAGLTVIDISPIFSLFGQLIFSMFFFHSLAAAAAGP
jgi:hypothetical protein